MSNTQAIKRSGNEFNSPPTLDLEEPNNNGPATNGKIESNYDINNDIKPTKKRYLILLLFCLHSMINAAQWIYLASITNVITQYYRVDNMAVNWTSMVYMAVYIPLVVPASWLFERLGMRNSILVSSFGTTMGSLIKCYSCQRDRFYILMIGQTIVAICQLFVLSVPPRLASIWFPDHQVALANACGVFGNQMGIALGFVVPQLVLGSQLVNEPLGAFGGPNSPTISVEHGLFNLFAGITFFSATISMLILVFFDKTPQKAPGIARLQQIKRENSSLESGTAPLVTDSTHNNSRFASLLHDLATNTNFLLLFASYGLNVGVFYALSTVLNQMLSGLWTDEASTLAGRLGLLMVFAGMLGSVISGYLLDLTHRYRAINTSLYGASLISIVLFSTALWIRNRLALYFTVTLLGFSMTGYLLIGYEMSNEITWPLPESISAGLLNLSAQVFGVLLTYASSYMVDNHGNFIANSFLTISILLGFVVTSLIRPQLRRQNAIGIIE